MLRRQRGGTRPDSTASIFPCRTGKLRVKFSSGSPPCRKIELSHRLGHDTHQESKAWQGTGREARKPSDASRHRTDHCQHTNSLIDNQAHLAVCGGDGGNGASTLRMRDSKSKRSTAMREIRIRGNGTGRPRRRYEACAARSKNNIRVVIMTAREFLINKIKQDLGLD